MAAVALCLIPCCAFDSVLRLVELLIVVVVLLSSCFHSRMNSCRSLCLNCFFAC
jgi:hypothetical protein